MATFTLPITRIREEPEFLTLVTDFENAAEQRRQQVDTEKRHWTWLFESQTGAERTTFDDFFVARKGKFESFTWTNPIDSVVYTVRFNDDRPRYDRDGLHYKWQVKVVEVK